MPILTVFVNNKMSYFSPSSIFSIKFKKNLNFESNLYEQHVQHFTVRKCAPRNLYIK